MELLIEDSSVLLEVVESVVVREVGLSVGVGVGVGVSVGVGVGVEVGSSQAGSPGEDVAVSNRAISCFRRSTRPGATFPPALFHLGSSSEATLDGFSPALRRLMRVEVRNCPHPTLKVKLTKAPYWLALRLTLWSTLALTQPSAPYNSAVKTANLCFGSLLYWCYLH